MYFVPGFFSHNAFCICSWCCMYQMFVLFDGWLVLPCVDISQLVYLFAVDGQLGYFQFFIILSKSVRNICVHVFAWARVWVSRRHIPRSGIAALCGKCVRHFIRILETGFHMAGPFGRPCTSVWELPSFQILTNPCTVGSAILFGLVLVVG